MSGYKLTEVGVIPEDWSIFSLSTLTDPQRPISYGIVQTGLTPINGVRCIRVVDIYNGEINKTELITTSKEISDSYRRTILKAGDLVMPLRGKVGDIGLVDDELEGANLTRGVALIALDDDCSPKFCQQIISFSTTRKRLEQAMNGSALQEIPIASLRSFKIPLPPTKTEQEAIAQALSDADALLATLDQMIAKKRDLKQAAMQQLLTGKTRLPGFSGEWEVKCLGEIAHIKTGSRNNEDKVEDGQYPFFVRSEFVERINSYSHDCEAILVPGEGRIGDIFHYINGRFDVHQRVYVITKFSPFIFGRFVHFYLSKNFGAWAMQNTVKATVDSLRLPTFLTFKMRMPPTLDEQIAIANALSDIDAELSTLETRRDKTTNIKQAMMQELLTGKTRLVHGGVNG